MGVRADEAVGVGDEVTVAVREAEAVGAGEGEGDDVGVAACVWVLVTAWLDEDVGEGDCVWELERAWLVLWVGVDAVEDVRLWVCVGVELHPTTVLPSTRKVWHPVAEAALGHERDRSAADLDPGRLRKAG